MDRLTAILNSNYIIRKNQIIQFYKINQEKSGISKSLVFALSNDCYPLFSDNKEFDMYDEFLAIQKEKIQTITKYIDENWVKNNFFTFYQLEDHFGGRSSRSDLIVVIRYCFLDRRFMRDGFWEKLDSDAPVEAHDLNTDIDIWEL